MGAPGGTTEDAVTTGRTIDLRAADLVSGLDEDQRRAVEIDHHPLCVLAGAGSGKTRVLTRRIARRAAVGDLDPRRTLALTFTRRAAAELRRRLRRLGLRDDVAAGTFHAIAYAGLRTRWADQGTTPPTLLERKVPFLVRLLPRRDDEVSPMDVAAEIEWASARLVGPDRYVEAAERARRRPPLPPETMARVMRRYHERKRDAGLVDFDDLLRLTIRAVADDPEFAAAQRWRFRHFFVDEFQDVNPLQHRTLRAWLGDRPDVCVVGDPHQAIYAWNGADARYLDRFTEHFPGGRVVRLTHNYRSTPQILGTAAAVLSGDGDRVAPLRAHRPDGPLPVVTEHDSADAEADAVARAVRDANRPGAPWSAQAVLVRTNTLAAEIGEALGRAGIPHRLRGAGSLLDRAEVKEALKLVRARPLDMALADVRAVVDRHERAPADDADDGPDGPDDGPDDEVADNLRALLSLADEYRSLDPEPSSPAFLAWLRTTVRAGDGDRGRDAVEVVTFHAAKGLEWDLVHLAGMEEGLAPIGHAKTEAARAEERRLVYVAMTRAREELRCTWARTRTVGRRTRDRRPSRYLGDVDDAVAAMAAGAHPVDWRPRLRAERERLRSRRGTRPGEAPGTDATVDPELLADLKRWRTDAARAADVPAFVIFHDRTLEAVAAARPGSADELLALPGIGPAKANRFGEALLALVDARRGPGPAP